MNMKEDNKKILLEYIEEYELDYFKEHFPVLFSDKVILKLFRYKVEPVVYKPVTDEMGIAWERIAETDFLVIETDDIDTKREVSRVFYDFQRDPRNGSVNFANIVEYNRNHFKDDMDASKKRYIRKQRIDIIKKI